MIPKIFLVAFLSLQGSNRQSPKEDAALEGTARFDVLNQPTTTTFRAATIGGIEDLSSPKVQTTGDDYQIPIQISPGQDAVIQRGSKEINVSHPLTLPLYPPPFLHPAIKLSCTNEKKYIRTYVNSLRLDAKKVQQRPPRLLRPEQSIIPRWLRDSRPATHVEPRRRVSLDCTPSWYITSMGTFSCRRPF